jgi:hypothetical protein
MLMVAAAWAAWLLAPAAPRGVGGRAQIDPWLRERAQALVESAPTVEVPRSWQRSVWLPEPGLAEILRERWRSVAMEDAHPVTLDPATGAIYAPGRGGLLRLGARSSVPTTIAWDAALPTPLAVAGLAFDRRRHRLMMAGATGGGTTVYLYTPTTGRWAAPATLPGDDAESLVYSEADDCFYALSRTRVGRAQVYAVTRIDAETGRPQWRIPVRERVAGRSDFSMGSLRPEQPQLASVGAFLAIVTPPQYDRTAAPPTDRQRFVVINPATGDVVYSGPVP